MPSSLAAVPGGPVGMPASGGRQRGVGGVGGGPGVKAGRVWRGNGAPKCLRGEAVGLKCSPKYKDVKEPYCGGVLTDEKFLVAFAFSFH